MRDGPRARLLDLYDQALPQVSRELWLRTQ